MTAEKEISFEKSMQSLETIIQKLEDGNLSLEESLSLYQEGIKEAANCKKQLDNAKLKIEEIEELS